MNFDTKEDVKIWIIKNQFGRRNLDSLSRVELAKMLEGFYKEKAKENLTIGGKITHNNQHSQPCPELDNPAKKPGITL